MNRTQMLKTVLGVTAILALAVALLTALGRRVDLTFSSVNSGLEAGAPAMAMPTPASVAQDGATGGSAPGLGDVAKPQQDQSGQTGLPPDGRLLIKNANLALQVEDVREAENSLRVTVGQFGGYVVKSETSGTDQYMNATITFRVPSQRFEQAMSGVQGLAKKVLNRSITGDDVTEEFVDLSARQRALEATRDRLLALLNKAERVEEALAVNTSLTDIQAQLEQIEGRKKFLTQSAALSTITVMLTPVPAVAPIVEPEGWQPAAVAREALRGLVEFAQGLASLGIVALVWSPVWLPVVALVFWWRRRGKARDLAQSA